MLQKEIETLRNDYSSQGIDVEDLPEEPYPLFSLWLEQAVQAGLPEPNGMIIATNDMNAEPSQRTVLMKSFDHSGLCFYTNYTSRKSIQLNQNPAISCLFPWLALHRQVSFQGEVRIVSAEQSREYFLSRPRASQIGAWASRQSEPLASRDELENRFQMYLERFEGRDVPYPEFWGGFQVVPTRVEFWQGRNSRLHDRVVFTRSTQDADWQIQFLNP